jgi:hypothetical protein
MGRRVLTHQESGWTNGTVAIEYLRWVSQKLKRQRICLVWDSFSAHHDEEVCAEAEADEIALKFIPSGMTDQWQPLDLRIFGSLKARAKALFDAEWMRDPDTELSTEDAIALLLRSWQSIEQGEILKAWQKLRDYEMLD